MRPTPGSCDLLREAGVGEDPRWRSGMVLDVSASVMIGASAGFTLL
jgi:hypothetical protein